MMHRKKNTTQMTRSPMKSEPMPVRLVSPCGEGAAAPSSRAICALGESVMGELVDSLCGVDFLKNPIVVVLMREGKLM